MLISVFARAMAEVYYFEGLAEKRGQVWDVYESEIRSYLYSECHLTS